MEIWTATRDTRLAASLGTLGVPIRLDSMIDERTGRSQTTFYLGVSSADGGVFVPNTKALKDRYEKKELDTEEPEHPLLDCLRGMYNWSMILDAVNKGRRIRLARVPGTSRTIYVDSDSGFPGVEGHGGLLRTGDVKMVAALGVVGVPILRVEGARGSRKFTLPCVGMKVGGEPARDAGLLMKQYREDTFTDFEHPFLYAMKAQVAKERLLDALNSEEKMVLIRKPRSSKAAYVNEGASDEKLDKMKRFFEGG